MSIDSPFKDFPCAWDIEPSCQEMSIARVTIEDDQGAKGVVHLCRQHCDELTEEAEVVSRKQFSVPAGADLSMLTNPHSRN